MTIRLDHLASDRYAIIIDGEHRGDVSARPSPHPRGISWHAVIYVGAYDAWVGMAQGHGDTPSAAIDDAMERTERDTRSYLAALEDLAHYWRQSRPHGQQEDPAHAHA
jgi:hypothetical protein